MDKKRRLEELFAYFPGIGPRQAKRFVYHIQSRSTASIQELVKLIQEVRSSTSECSMCHRFFVGQSDNKELCNICGDTSRDSSLLMVVARDSDLESVEKSAAYKGLYFVLGGTIPILDKEPEKRVRLGALVKRLSNPSSVVKEVIISLNTTPDGEHTRDIVVEEISHSHPNTKISALGRGLSTGAELEYVDADTIRNALSNRK